MRKWDNSAAKCASCVRVVDPKGIVLAKGWSLVAATGGVLVWKVARLAVVKDAQKAFLAVVVVPVSMVHAPVVRPEVKEIVALVHRAAKGNDVPTVHVVKASAVPVAHLAKAPVPMARLVKKGSVGLPKRSKLLSCLAA